MYTFFSFFYFNWRLITLQYCGGFCPTLSWISHRCTCVPHPDPPSTSHPIPQGHPSAPALSTLSHTLNLDWRSISHTIIYIFQCYNLKSSHPRLFPESKSLFFTSVFLFHIGSFSYYLSKFHICALITVLVFFFRTYFTLYNRLKFQPPQKNWFKCILFNSWVIFHCVYVSHLYIHSSADGHLGCFHVLDIENSATTNTGVHMSLSILVSSVCMPSSGIAGS